jgi:hypothetical protein
VWLFQCGYSPAVPKPKKKKAGSVAGDTTSAAHGQVQGGGAAADSLPVCLFDSRLEFRCPNSRLHSGGGGGGGGGGDTQEEEEEEDCVAWEGSADVSLPTVAVAKSGGAEARAQRRAVGISSVVCLGATTPVDYCRRGTTSAAEGAARLAPHLGYGAGSAAAGSLPVCTFVLCVESDSGSFSSAVHAVCVDTEAPLPAKRAASAVGNTMRSLPARGPSGVHEPLLEAPLLSEHRDRPPGRSHGPTTL